MNSYPLGPYDFDRISGNYAAESSFTGAASEVASAGANDPTVQLSAEDNDSDDLLKYIPYLDELEKIEKLAAEQQEKERADGTYLLKLLDTGDFDQGLVKEFKTMINMTKHMNAMLFKGDKASGFKVRTHTLNQVETIAVQVIHYFDKLSDQFDAGIDKIVEIKQYLPSLASRVKADSVRTALKVWNTKILGELACPRDCEMELFDGFATFFDAQIYHPFLELRKANPKHEMCRSLEEHFHAIDHYVEHTTATYAVLIREHKKFKTTMARARKRLLGNANAIEKLSRAERTFNTIKAKMEREGAAADAALAATAAAAAAAATATATTATNETADIADVDQYFAKLDLGEDPSDGEVTPTNEHAGEKGKEKASASKPTSKSKRNSKGKSGSGKGKGKRRSK